MLFRYGSHGEKESYEFRRLYREKNNYVVSHQVFLANHLMFFSHRWREHAIKSTDKATAHKYSAYFQLDPAQHSKSMQLSPESQVGQFPLLGANSTKSQAYQFQREHQISLGGIQLCSHFSHEWRVQQTYSWFRQVTVQMPFLHYVPLL